MSDSQHSITPPPELVEQWRTAPEYTDCREKLTMVSMTTRRLQEIAAQAAQWGADRELEACCEALEHTDCSDYIWPLEQAGYSEYDWLRAARRPKLPSLKEQADE